MLKKTIAFLALAASAFSLSGCDSPGASDTAKASGDASLSVAASFYPTVFLAERIGGEHVTVTSVTPPDVEPHDYELSPAEVATLGKQDVLFYVSGFQPSLDDAVTELGLDASTAVNLASAVNLTAYGTEGSESEQDGARQHEGTDDAAHEDPHETAHDSHVHATFDPHFWLDPERMSAAADAIADALGAAAPQGAAEYEANAAQLRTELDALDSEFEAVLGDSASACESTALVTPHEAFGYLASAYGLTARSIALDAESEPSPARLAELAREIKAEGATAVFAESRASRSSIEALASEAGVSIEELDPLEVQPADGDYLDAMRANLDALTTGLRCG